MVTEMGLCTGANSLRAEGGGMAEMPLELLGAGAPLPPGECPGGSGSPCSTQDKSQQ